MALVEVADALNHLRISAEDADAETLLEVSSKLAEAEDWATDIMGANFNPAWVYETLPGRIRSAMLVYLTGVYDGDPDGKYLDVANRLIERWRDHTMA